MRRLINALAALIVICVACDREDYWKVNMYAHRGGGYSEKTEKNGGGRDSQDSVASPPLKKEPHLYVSGVKYPAKYDWRRDETYGNVETTVFLMRDDEEVLRMASGGNNPVFSDEDMHRINGGHLYCDYQEDGQSVWLCDGEELFRLKESVLTRGFVIRGNNHYVLTEPRKGSGVILWKEGGKEFSSTGKIISELYSDGNKLCFSYYAEDGSANLVIDGRVLPVSKPVGQSEARMVRYSSGRCYAVYAGQRNVSLYVDGEWMCSLDTPYYSYFLPQPFPVRELSVGGNSPYLVLELRQTDSTSTSYCYHGQSLKQTYKGESCFAAVLPDSDNEDIWFLGYNGQTKRYSLYKESDRLMEFPLGWRPHCRRACQMYDSVFSIGMDTPDGPVLWSSDGKNRQYGFNGYIDEILTVLE